MNHRSKITTRVDETCVICKEALIEQTFGETRHEYGLPGEERSQVDIVFYGLCEKCLEKDDVWDVFNMLVYCHREAISSNMG